MKLRDWMSDNDKTHEEIAAAVGCSRFSVHKWIVGVCPPSRPFIRIIKILTNNQVTEKDFKQKEKKNV